MRNRAPERFSPKVHSESGGWDGSPHPVTVTRTPRLLWQPHVSAVLRSGPRSQRDEAAGPGGVGAAGRPTQPPWGPRRGSSTRNAGREGRRDPVLPLARGLPGQEKRAGIGAFLSAGPARTASRACSDRDPSTSAATAEPRAAARRARDWRLC